MRQRMKLSSYLDAIRPRSLSTALIPTLLGYILACKINPQNKSSNLISTLTILTVLSVYCAGNLVSTYFYFNKCIGLRKNDTCSSINSILSKDEVVSFSGILYAVGLFGLICLAAFSPAKIEHLALIYFGGLSSSFLCADSIGLRYIHMGSAHIPIIFSPASAIFAYLCHTGELEWGTIYYAIPLALNTEAILHSSNIRNESSWEAKTATPGDVKGYTFSHILCAFLLFMPYILFVVLATRKFYWFLLPLLTAPLAFKHEKRFRNPENFQSVTCFTFKSNVFFGILYVLAISLTDSFYPLTK